MDATIESVSKFVPMRRTRHDVFARAATVRYIVLWTIHWQTLACQRLAPGTDLHQAIRQAAAALVADNWGLEGDTVNGFVFVNRGGERRLLMVTERDPSDDSLQSFDPFR